MVAISDDFLNRKTYVMIKKNQWNTKTQEGQQQLSFRKM